MICFGLRPIIRMFENRSVMVSGMKGSGKDVLFGNVIMRRKLPYISNFDYGGVRYPFEPSKLDCGGNTYRNFLTGKVLRYVYPYKDFVDVYISDLANYLPAQYDHELNKDFPYLPTYFSLSRQVGESCIHANVQAVERGWKKLREQFDQYINCQDCRFIGPFVFQRVIVYEKYQSAVDRVPVFPLRRPLLNLDRVQRYELAKCNYLISHGRVEPYLLIYRNRSKHDTRAFKKILEEGAPA